MTTENMINVFGQIEAEDKVSRIEHLLGQVKVLLGTAARDERGALGLVTKKVESLSLHGLTAVIRKRRASSSVTFVKCNLPESGMTMIFKISQRSVFHRLKKRLRCERPVLLTTL